MKNAPLTTGIILLVIGLVGILFSQFSIFWMWVLVIVGIIVITWTVMQKKDKDILKK